MKVGLRAVVIDSQAPTHIQILEPRSPLVQVDINTSGFNQGRFDIADVADLAPLVIVKQLEAVRHFAGLQFFQPP